VPATLAAVSVLAGCTVGPKYSRPTVETPTNWKEQPPDGWKTATPNDTISKGNWWEIFGEQQLNDYETQAIAANQNLRAAAQRVLEARASAQVTRSQEFPKVTGLPSALRERNSGNGVAPPGSHGFAYQANDFIVPADVSYEVDLWGSVRHSIESANELTQVSVAQYENVLLTLKSDVAEDYIMVRFIDQEREILKNNIDLQQKALDLTQARHNGGVASGLDVSEAETLLDTTEGSYIGLGVQRSQFEHALAVLLGKAPAEFSMAENPLNFQPPALPPGLPSDLLERRPDIAEAERIMASDNAQIGIARAAYFPALNLTGDAGFLSEAFSRLFTVPSMIWSVGANASQPIFTGGALSGNMQRARATYDESVADYRQQVLTAFQQVEDGLSGLRVLEQQSAAYDKAVKSAQQTVDISTSRYREGLANFLEVIDAQVTLLTNQRVSDQILEQRLLTTVSLIQALGGGWQDSKIYTSDSSNGGKVASPAITPATPGASGAPATQ
jgi:NodT family efflux transporter outer membrane factor (OMF) lipoprotein